MTDQVGREKARAIEVLTGIAELSEKWGQIFPSTAKTILTHITALEEEQGKCPECGWPPINCACLEIELGKKADKLLARCALMEPVVEAAVKVREELESEGVDLGDHIDFVYRDVLYDALDTAQERKDDGDE